MHRPTITAMLLAIALLACGAADKEQAPRRDKTAGGKEDSRKDEPPACMHCGATCCLEPICVCEPGTKKRPKTEFETKCEPICVAGCGSKPWPWGPWQDRAGCANCREEPGGCPGWVRNRRTLKKETVDEEVPTITRRVAYVCGACARGRVGSCTGSCGPRPHAAWWTRLTWWWPRTPAP